MPDAWRSDFPPVDLKAAPRRHNPAAVCHRLPLRLIACNSPTPRCPPTASVPTGFWRTIQTLAGRNSRSQAQYSCTRGRSERPPSHSTRDELILFSPARRHLQRCHCSKRPRAPVTGPAAVYPSMFTQLCRMRRRQWRRHRTLERKARLAALWWLPHCPASLPCLTAASAPVRPLHTAGEGLTVGDSSAKSSPGGHSRYTSQKAFAPSNMVDGPPLN